MRRWTSTVTPSQQGINPNGYPARLIVRRVTFCLFEVSWLRGSPRPSADLRKGVEPDRLKGSSQSAPVAQLDRASGYEPEGRVFESPRAHHRINNIVPRAV